MHIKLTPALERYTSRRLRALGRVRTLIIDSVNLERLPDEIDPDTALFGTGLGLDSLDAAEIMIGLEVDFGIRLEGQESHIVGLRSVNAIVDLVLRHEGDVP